MKRILCSLLLVTTLITCGCGKKELTPNELFQKMMDNMQNIESVTAKIDIEIDIEEEEKTVVDFGVDMKIQEKSEKSFLTAMDMKMKYGSMGINFDTYLDFNDTNFTMYMKNFVITIGREFGSGGREIGEMLAEKLNFTFYSERLAAKASEATGIDEEFFREVDEKQKKSFWYMFAMSNLLSDDLDTALRASSYK